MENSFKRLFLRMQKTTIKNMHVFFTPFFFLLFLFSFFLIEGEYRFYLFSLWAIFLLFFSQKLIKSELAEHKISKTTIFALILSVLFAVNLIFSRQVPLSIEKLLFYLLSLAIFIFFSSPKTNAFKPKLFFYYLSILTLVLNILVIFFTFCPDQPDLFPGMNLLMRNYGHNHYAAFLLLVTPIFWWQFLFKNEEKKANQESDFLMVILLISSYLLIILSLARLALLISLIQLIIIFLTNKEAFTSLGNNSFVKVIAKTFIFIFLSIGMLFLFLSTPLNKNGESLCPLIFSKKEICRPLLKNDRLVYWQNAWLVFKESPYFGVGLKNFNFASRKFPIKDQQVTSYAHNIFLHNLAEGGLLTGGFFIFFVLYIFHRSFVLMKSSGKPLHKFLWLAAAASFFNAMFDFDWNFFVIFGLTLIFLAIILQSDNSGITTRKRYFKGYYIFIMVFAVFFAVYNLSAKIIYKINKPELIIKYLPYSDYQVRSLLSDKKLSSDDFLTLYPLYSHDAEFLFRFISLEQLDLKKKVVLQIEYADLNPSSFINNVEFDDYDFQTANPLADKFIEVLIKHNFLNNRIFLDYWDQRNIAQQFFNFANQAYEANNPELAASYYKKAIFLNEFVMGDRRSSFLDSTDLVQAAIFLKYFKDFNPESMNQYFYEYMGFYGQTLMYLFQNDQLDNFFVLAQEIFAKQYNFSWFLWRDLIASSKTAEENQRLSKVYEHFQDMTTWYDFLPLK